VPKGRAVARFAVMPSRRGRGIDDRRSGDVVLEGSKGHPEVAGWVVLSKTVLPPSHSPHPEGRRSVWPAPARGASGSTSNTGEPRFWSPGEQLHCQPNMSATASFTTFLAPPHRKALIRFGSHAGKSQAVSHRKKGSMES